MNVVFLFKYINNTIPWKLIKVWIICMTTQGVVRMAEGHLFTNSSLTNFGLRECRMENSRKH